MVQVELMCVCVVRRQEEAATKRIFTFVGRLRW